MSKNRVVSDDQKLLDLYRKFLETRRTLGEIYPFTQFENFLDNGSYSASALPVVLMAQDQIIGATNALNRFCYDLHAITAWNRLFHSITEDEKILAIYEFLFPAASDALSAPYAIKQLFVTSVCQISHETKCFSNRHEEPLKKQLNFGHADQLAAKFGSWPALRSTRSLLNDEAFTDASDNYRNKLNHGFPRRIEFGHTFSINRLNDKGHIAYSVADAPPLRLVELIPPLAEQYKIALDCFGAYVGLVKEQHASWPRA